MSFHTFPAAILTAQSFRAWLTNPCRCMLSQLRRHLFFHTGVTDGHASSTGVPQDISGLYFCLCGNSLLYCCFSCLCYGRMALLTIGALLPVHLRR